MRLPWSGKGDGDLPVPRADPPQTALGDAVTQMLRSQVAAQRSRFDGRIAYLRAQAALTDSRDAARLIEARIEEATFLLTTLEG